MALSIFVVCAGCGASDARSSSPASTSQRLSPTSDAALERMMARCDASCEPARALSLAQHLLERAQALRREALDAEERGQAARDPVTRQRARGAAEQANRDATRERDRAITLLQGVVQDATVPPSRVVESALAELLFALADRPTHDEAVAVAERIVRDLPTRPLAADAWLAIAEQAFERADLLHARQAYLATAAVPGADARIVVYAKYKLGWTYFNLSDFGAACEAFREVAHASSQPLIAREAQRDFVRALVPLDKSAAEDAAEIRSVAPGAAAAADLADRYEQALREVGLDRRADAFRGAWR